MIVFEQAPPSFLNSMHHPALYETHQPLPAETGGSSIGSHDNFRRGYQTNANVPAGNSELQFATLESVSRPNNVLVQPTHPLPLASAVSPYSPHLPPAMHHSHLAMPLHANAPAYYLGMQNHSHPYALLPHHLLPPLSSSDPHRAMEYGSRAVPAALDVGSMAPHNAQQQSLLDSRGRKTAVGGVAAPMPSYTRDYLENTRDYYNRNLQQPPPASSNRDSGAPYHKSARDDRSSRQSDHHNRNSSDDRKNHHASSSSHPNDRHRSEVHHSYVHGAHISTTVTTSSESHQPSSSASKRFSVDALVRPTAAPSHNELPPRELPVSIFTGSSGQGPVAVVQAKDDFQKSHASANIAERERGKHFKIPKSRAAYDSGSRSVAENLEPPTGSSVIAAPIINTISSAVIVDKHSSQPNDSARNTDSCELVSQASTVSTEAASTTVVDQVATQPPVQNTEASSSTSGQPVPPKAAAGSEPSKDDDYHAEDNESDESSEEAASEEDDGSASESDYEDVKRFKPAAPTKKPAKKQAAVSSTKPDVETNVAKPLRSSHPAATGAPPKIRSGFHEVAAEGSASDRLALRKVRTLAEEDPETYGLRRSGRQRVQPVRFCGNAADDLDGDLSAAEDDLGYIEPRTSKKTNAGTVDDDDDQLVGKQRGSRRRRGEEADSDYEGDAAAPSSKRVAAVDDDADDDDESGDDDELEYDSEDGQASDEDDFIVDDSSDENFSRSRGGGGDPWSRKRGTTSRARRSKKSSRRDKIRKKAPSSQPPRVRSGKQQQHQKRSGSTMRENLKKWDNSKTWAVDSEDEEDEIVGGSKRNRKRVAVVDADEAAAHPAAANGVNDLDIRRSERQAVRASHRTAAQSAAGEGNVGSAHVSRYAVDQLSDTDPDDVLSWTVDNTNLNNVDGQPGDSQPVAVDSGVHASVIEKVLDERQGRRGATGEATTFYNCEQFGDPNLKAPAAVGSELGASGQETEPSAVETQYLIKWEGQSYLHCTWETEDTLKALKCKTFKKLENFVKRRQDHEALKSKAEAEEREYIACQEEMQRELIEQHKIIERIIASRVVQVSDDEPTPPPSPVPDAAANDSDDSARQIKTESESVMPKKENSAQPTDAVEQSETKQEAAVDDVQQKQPPKQMTYIDQVEYYCKWIGLPYAESTWEKADLINERFPAATVDFERRCKNINRLPHVEKRAACLRQRPKFKYINEQPAYVGPTDENLLLRDYQLSGLNWLVNSWTKCNGSILADEMGLGKTIQTISFVNYLFHEYDLFGPYLLVVPLSTMTAWQKESALWAPELNIITYVGDASSRELIRQFEWRDDEYAPKKLKFHVLLTTYEILLRDKNLLGEIDWAALMVDEAHRLKNDDSQLYVELFAFKTDHRILITGTPLQNSLRELWALLHFIMPDKFASWPDFEREHAKSAERGYDTLHGILQPFLLRRVKKEVEKSLPAKVEQILRVNMTAPQKQVYRWILTKNYTALTKGLRGNYSGFLNILMELKKCCNHVQLIRPPEVEMTPRETLSYLIRNSGKLVLLDKLLTRLREKGSRVLIFSQMVRMLDILATYLKLKGYQFQRLDGTIGGDMRRQAMDHFNAPNSTDFCFLLSTRAGGLGINLATADTVVIYDSDWNPQNDLQAQARAHRIGQKKQVNIYRLVTSDSVEQDIVDRAKRKMVLDHLVIQRMDSSGRSIVGAAATAMKSGNLPFDKDEVAAIIKFGAKGLFDDSASANDGGENGVVNPENEAMPNVDIDEILRRAENASQDDAATGGKSAAEELLSQFKVASFAMGAEHDDGAAEAAVGGENGAASNGGERKELTWDDIIPAAVRQRMQEEANERMAKALAETRPQRRAAKLKSAAALLSGKKQTAKKKKSGRPVSASGSVEGGSPASDDSEANDSENSEASESGSEGSNDEQEKSTAVTGKQSKTSASKAARARTAGAVQPKSRLQLGRHFTQLEVKRFIEAWKKFADPLLRLDAIVADADLQDKSQQHLRMLADELDVRLRTALEPVADEIDGTTVASENSDDENENANDVGKKSGTKAKKNNRRKRTFVFKLCSLALNAQTIMRSREELLPLGYFIRLSPSGDAYQFQVPGKVRAINVWDCEWTADDDSRLLVGIYLYGLGNWDAIKHDAKLQLTTKVLPIKHNQKPQARHLQQRAEWLLKHLRREMDGSLQKMSQLSAQAEGRNAQSKLSRKASPIADNAKNSRSDASDKKRQRRKRGDHGDSCDEDDDGSSESDVDDLSVNSNVSELGSDASPSSSKNSNETTSPPTEKVAVSSKKHAKPPIAKKQLKSASGAAKPSARKTIAKQVAAPSARGRASKQAPVSKAQIDSSDDSSSGDEEKSKATVSSAKKKQSVSTDDRKKRPSSGENTVSAKRLKTSSSAAATKSNAHGSVSEEDEADDGEEMSPGEFQKCKELLRPMKHQLIAIDKASYVKGVDAQLTAMRAPLAHVGRFIKNVAATSLATNLRQLASASSGKNVAKNAAASASASKAAVKANKVLKQNLWNFVAKFTEHTGEQLNRYFKQHDGAAASSSTSLSNKLAKRIVSPPAAAKSGAANSNMPSKKIPKLTVTMPSAEQISVSTTKLNDLRAIPKLIIKTSQPAAAATVATDSATEKSDNRRISDKNIASASSSADAPGSQAAASAPLATQLSQPKPRSKDDDSNGRSAGNVDAASVRTSKKLKLSSADADKCSNSQAVEQHNSAHEISTSSSSLSSDTSQGQEDVTVKISAKEQSDAMRKSVSVDRRTSVNSNGTSTKTASRRERLPPSYRYRSHASDQQMELQLYTSSVGGDGAVVSDNAAFMDTEQFRKQTSANEPTLPQNIHGTSTAAETVQPNLSVSAGSSSSADIEPAANLKLVEAGTAALIHSPLSD